MTSKAKTAPPKIVAPPSQEFLDRQREQDRQGRIAQIKAMRGNAGRGTQGNTQLLNLLVDHLLAEEPPT